MEAGGKGSWGKLWSLQLAWRERLDGPGGLHGVGRKEAMARSVLLLLVLCASSTGCCLSSLLSGGSCRLPGLGVWAGLGGLGS